MLQKCIVRTVAQHGIGQKMLNVQKKAFWIVDQLEDVPVDDVIDVLLGTITRPINLVQDILRLSDEYDLAKETGLK